MEDKESIFLKKGPIESPMKYFMIAVSSLTVGGTGTYALTSYISSENKKSIEKMEDKMTIMEDKFLNKLEGIGIRLAHIEGALGLEPVRIRKREYNDF